MLNQVEITPSMKWLVRLVFMSKLGEAHHVHDVALATKRDEAHPFQIWKLCVKIKTDERRAATLIIRSDMWGC